MHTQHPERAINYSVDRNPRQIKYTRRSPIQMLVEVAVAAVAVATGIANHLHRQSASTGSGCWSGNGIFNVVIGLFVVQTGFSFVLCPVCWHDKLFFHYKTMHVMKIQKKDSFVQHMIGFCLFNQLDTCIMNTMWWLGDISKESIGVLGGLIWSLWRHFR